MQKFLEFLKNSPTVFHSVDSIKQILLNNGYQELLESDKWEVQNSGKYFIIRNMSSIIAFHIGNDLDQYGFHIAASHGDYPTFKLKENAEVEVKDKYLKLNTEGYGGMICSTWFDRPLSIAGRVVVKENNILHTKLINFDRDLVLIPSQAIHMNRSMNNGYTFNKQIDLLPLFAGNEGRLGDFDKLIAKELNVDLNQIYGRDLYLYNRTPASIWGLNNEFISSGHLDNLQSAYGSLQGFLNGNPNQTINVYVCFDSEEVGSMSKQGAGSTFLYDSLKRIHYALGKEKEEFYQALANSFMFSIDSAHALHPNHPEKMDETNRVYMNEGVVLKFQGEQRYTTDGFSQAITKELCKQSNVPIQYFANRSDERGGTTLGHVATSHVSIHSADIGMALLSMHSSYETIGSKDTDYLIKLMEYFFTCNIIIKDSTKIQINKGGN